MKALRRVIQKNGLRRRDLLYSAVIAFGLSILSYLFNNQPLFTGEDLEQYAWMEWVKDKLPTKQEDTIQPLYINVSYDKQLVEYHDQYGMPIGNTDITDRQKLLSLLKMLRSTGQYKYVFLDVRFEKGYDTEADSALFWEISHMDRIAVATHSDMELADTLLAKKSAINDYSATITTSFVRYEFSHEGKPSMPLYAYSEITGKTIERYGLMYICDGKLCYNSLFIRFPVESFDGEYEQEHKVYYHLGADILDNYEESDIAVLTKDKYIVIGNLVEDVHDTYAGSKPGSVITFYAFRALMKGEQIVSWWVMLLFGVIYFCISLSLFSPHSWMDCLPSVRKSKAMYFCLSFIGYGCVLTVIAIVLNVFLNIATTILLPSVFFTIQNYVINYKRLKL